MPDSYDFNQVKAADRADILELDRRIKDYHRGKEDEERFRLYRLTRGVYGQRQSGVQMFRIKIPYGRLTAEQLVRIADISEKYTNGNLHLTTRQNIQLHYVKLDDSPAIWTELAQKDITAREACGNTVRNLTGSARAGIDPDEPFDVSPYVQAAFEYFLRNPICQDMGRKIKPAFSSSEKDSAFTYFHDFGFIPRVRTVDGKDQRGFKVVVGGGLGAQSMVAQTVYEFLEEDRIIPFMEAAIRVFDRYGEREKRMKARMKFLVKSLGLEAFLELVNEELSALANQRVAIDRDAVPPAVPAPYREAPTQEPADEQRYALWRLTNVFEQKQKGYYGVQLKVRLGNIHARQARALAELVNRFAADDIRITVNQGLLLKFVRPEALPYVFNVLESLDLAEPGFDTIADITACPGTDTCALGVTNSTGLAQRLEEVVWEEYADLVEESDIRIKISGCMNSCGQHMAAQIGFHGSSIKKDGHVVPAMQIVLGGGVDPQGNGFVADRVIKLPTKRIPDALRTLLGDYAEHGALGERFNDYVNRQGKRYFYGILKPLADTSDLRPSDFMDWGQDHEYVQEIGVGECAGVTLDVVNTILDDAREKVVLAGQALEEGAFGDSIYHAYTTFVITAKALLLSRDVKCNTHRKILDDFQALFVDEEGLFHADQSFPELVLRLKAEKPSKELARQYRLEAGRFVDWASRLREAEVKANGGQDKLVIEHYYQA